jgi:hypothetical protein
MRSVGGTLGRLAALAAVVFAAGGAPAPPPLPELNEKVLAFAREKLGTSVGDGSCTTLAVEALKEAGARRYPMGDPEGDYTWGEPVASFKDALPGDVLQFHKAVFQGRTPLPGRRWYSWKQEYPHHTAIVSKVSQGGKVVSLLHQNVTAPGQPAKDVKNVQETTLRVDSLQKGGRIRIYRPVPWAAPAASPPPSSAPEPGGEARDS